MFILSNSEISKLQNIIKSIQQYIWCASQIYYLTFFVETKIQVFPVQHQQGLLLYICSTETRVCVHTLWLMLLLMCHCQGKKKRSDVNSSPTPTFKTMPKTHTYIVIYLMITLTGGFHILNMIQYTNLQSSWLNSRPVDDFSGLVHSLLKLVYNIDLPTKMWFKTALCFWF